jgi:hypothetical protein
VKGVSKFTATAIAILGVMVGIFSGWGISIAAEPQTPVKVHYVTETRQTIESTLLAECRTVASQADTNTVGKVESGLGECVEDVEKAFGGHSVRPAR